MKLNIKSLNKELFKRCIEEQEHRDKFPMNCYKRQIAEGHTYGNPEGFQKSYEMYLRKEEFHKRLKNDIENSVINISEEEKDFLKSLIEDQIYVSNSRIDDWQHDKRMYNAFKIQWKIDNKPLKEYNATVQKIIQIDIDNIEFCNKLAELLSNIENN